MPLHSTLSCGSARANASERRAMRTYVALSLITSASVSAGKEKSDAATLAQLRAAAAELGLGLSGLLGAEITATCCASGFGSAPTSGELVASIVPEARTSLVAILHSSLRQHHSF